MLLDDGIVYICELVDASENGGMPRQILRKRSRSWFNMRTVGYGRYYAAQGVNEQVDMLIRIWFNRDVRIGMYAVLGNGEQFRITNVQQLYNEDELRVTDLTLSRVEKNYDID